MSDVKWIKITTDIFDDDKILLIESLPDADSLIVIWFKLLCLAGKQNNSGVFMLNDKIPYTDRMLATIFRRKETTVQLALKTFKEFGMIEIIDGVITIPNWGKHQNLDQLEKKRERMRSYMRDYREKQKSLAGATVNQEGLPLEDWMTVLEEFGHECAYCGAVDELEQDHVVSVDDDGKCCIGNIVPACRRCNASKGNKDVFVWYKKQDFYDEDRCKRLRKYLRKYLRNSNVSEADIEGETEGEERENREEITLSNERVCRTKDVRRVIEAWNKTGLTPIRAIQPDSDRGKMTRKRITDFGVDVVLEAIQKAGDSRFLAGENKRGFTATYDWFIRPNNFQKCIEVNYDNRNASDGDGKLGFLDLLKEDGVEFG